MADARPPRSPGPGLGRRSGPVRVIRDQPEATAKPALPRLRAVMQRAQRQAAKVDPATVAERVRALGTRYLRERWRCEPRFVRLAPNAVEPGTWTAVFEDPRNPAAALQPVTVRIDPVSGVVGML